MVRLSTATGLPVTNNRSSSLDKVPQLVGQLGSDGIANLQADTTYTAPKTHGAPRSLKAALEALRDSVRSSSDTAWEIPSEEDYDAIKHDPMAMVAGGTGRAFGSETNGAETPDAALGKTHEGVTAPSSKSRPGL